MLRVLGVGHMPCRGTYPPSTKPVAPCSSFSTKQMAPAPNAAGPNPLRIDIAITERPYRLRALTSFRPSAAVGSARSTITTSAAALSTSSSATRAGCFGYHLEIRKRLHDRPYAETNRASPCTTSALIFPATSRSPLAVATLLPPDSAGSSRNYISFGSRIHGTDASLKRD